MITRAQYSYALLWAAYMTAEPGTWFEKACLDAFMERVPQAAKAEARRAGHRLAEVVV